MNNIGTAIARLRKNNEMTQEELAVKIGVSAQTISKWENGTTMPDVLMLPVIAEMFDVTVDFLFGRESKSMVMPIGSRDVPKKGYEEFIFTMTRSFMYEEMPSDAVWADAMEKIVRLERKPQSQALIKYGDKGGMYANKDLGIVWRHDDRDSLGLLDDTSVGEILKAFGDNNFRKLMKYQMKNPNASFTAASVGAKCSIPTEEAKIALEKLAEYNFSSKMKVDLGEETVDVFHIYAQYKMVMVFTMLSLAQRLANYVDWYDGMNC